MAAVWTGGQRGRPTSSCQSRSRTVRRRISSRRNPAYGEDYNTTQALIAAGDVPADAGMAQLARRWGLSFPAST